MAYSHDGLISLMMHTVCVLVLLLKLPTDVYEPEFFNPLVDWSGREAYSIQLTFNDYAYTKDIFYFCHVSFTFADVKDSLQYFFGDTHIVWSWLTYVFRSRGT